MELAAPPHLAATLACFQNGRWDPTTHWDGTSFSRAVRTTSGVATLRLQVFDGRVVASAAGLGADEALSRAQSFIGCADTPPSIVPLHDAVSRAQRAFGGLRIGASQDPYHELLRAILGQRITAAEAARQWRLLCIRFGEPVPVLADTPQLFLPPAPEVLESIPYWQLHPIGIERRRAESLRAAANSRHLLQTLCGMTPASATSQLQLVRGVGQWTAAVAGFAAFGDTDALCVGDFHAKNTVVFALTGKHRGTDDEMCGLLECYAPHRARVLRWLELDGWKAPSHGPRRRNLSIARF